jgi:hypothetical protein
MNRFFLEFGEHSDVFVRDVQFLVIWVGDNWVYRRGNSVAISEVLCLIGTGSWDSVSFVPPEKPTGNTRHLERRAPHIRPGAKRMAVEISWVLARPTRVGSHRADRKLRRVIPEFPGDVIFPGTRGVRHADRTIGGRAPIGGALVFGHSRGSYSPGPRVGVVSRAA